ncbi:MAG: hypothetical protein SOR74_06450 [Candidatus Faecivicinus sp.]|nr:hypothetical protein [Candidatus Faecivicinus sp.]
MADRDIHGRFVKGNKAQGTSGGRPKLAPDERLRIQALGRMGLDKLEALLTNEEIDTNVQARVAIFCVEKAFGKARQEIETKGADGSMPCIIIRRPSEDER